MLEIATLKIARVIMLAREYGADSPRLHRWLEGLNEDEAVSLVALMWIGRETYGPDELEEAKRVAAEEASAPAADYLSGEPALPDYLEAGLDALGIDVTDVEENY